METKFKGKTISTIGNLPKVGTQAPIFTLTKGDLTNVSLSDFLGSRVILNIFPSLDTSVCAISVRKFNEIASKLDNTKVLCISKDLPFAQARFCIAENIKNVEVLSDFRNGSFANDYGVLIKDGDLAGLLARAIVVIDANGKTLYSAMNSEIAEEPDYQSALDSLK